MTVIKKRVRAKKKNGIKTGITKQIDVVEYCHICNKEVAIMKEIDERSDKEIKKIHNFRSYPASWFKDEKIKSDRVFICNKCQPGTKAWDEKYPDGEMHKTLLNYNEIKKEERKKMADQISLKELSAVGKELNEAWELIPAIEEIERDELEVRIKREGLAEMQITAKENDVENLSKQTLFIMLQLEAVPKELIERVQKKVGKPKKEEDKKVAKKVKEKKKAAAKKAPAVKKAGEKGKPGVIASIFEFVKAASKTKPISEAQLLANLKKRFPDRDAGSMGKTIKAQLPKRMNAEKKITVVLTEKGFYVK